MQALTYDEAIAEVQTLFPTERPSSLWEKVDAQYRRKFTTRFDGRYSIDYDTKRDVYVLKYSPGADQKVAVKITNHVAEFLLKHMGPRWPSVIYLLMADGVVVDVVAVML
jgi:hypothetical protein